MFNSRTTLAKEKLPVTFSTANSTDVYTGFDVYSGGSAC